jgi:hypothetical protein
MDRQFAFKPDRPLLVFYDDLLKVRFAAAATAATAAAAALILFPPRFTSKRRARS